MKHTYSRAEVCRLLSVTERQLRAWEKNSFVAASETFGFTDLLALKTLAALQQGKVRPAQIRRALSALRDKLEHVRNPLAELKLYSDGRKIKVQFAGQKMEPVSGQLLLDFDAEEISRLLAFPGKEKRDHQAGEQQRRRLEAERWFEKGIDLEQTGAPLEQIVEAYEKAADLGGGSAGALVNLGTIFFNQRKWREAEKYYVRALEADPEYALAHFNLGNLFDERGDRAKAMVHYQTALQLNPNYADAHYNLAVLHQAANQPLKAVRHWKAYLKIDPNSAWASIARRELAKLRDSTIVRGLRRE